MMHTTALNIFMIFTSLVTVTSVFLHDTRLDKAAFVATLPISTLSAETGAKLVHISPNDFHTHVERTSLGHAASFLHASPSVIPRAQEDKKHLMQRNVGRGHHAFDNYYHPLV